jgi:antitoxin component YwqK of YwqJK toxin-antitoxin module
MDEASVKVYAKVVPKEVTKLNKDSVQTQVEENNLTFGVFNPNGYNKLFNIQFNKIEKEGYFKNGILYTGKQYIYDEKGNLIRLAEYKEGKLISDQKFKVDSLKQK